VIHVDMLPKEAQLVKNKITKGGKIVLGLVPLWSEPQTRSRDAIISNFLYANY